MSSSIEYRALCETGDILGHAEITHKRGGWWSVVLYANDWQLAQRAGYPDAFLVRRIGHRSEQGARAMASIYVEALWRLAIHEAIEIHGETEARARISHSVQICEVE